LAQKRQVNKPIKINADKDPKYLGLDEARFMLNAERNVGGGSKANSGKTTPIPANELICLTTVTVGTPYLVGKYRSDLTNEVYAFYYVEGGENYILRINEDKTCEIVYQGDCLLLSPDPKHSLEDWRIYLKYDRFCPNQGGKQLIWTDGINPIGMIDVEASIATDSFTTPFFDDCLTGCEALQLCVPEICGAVQGEFLPLDPNQIDLNNRLVDEAIQIIIRHVYYDRRASEWSIPSTLFYQDIGGCFDSEEGKPRCIQLTIPLGNPLVEKIEIAFRRNNEPQFYLSDTVEKYLPYTSDTEKWYERDLAPLLNISTVDCTFDYIFCNDKGALPISPIETSRVFNPAPREAQGLVRVKDSLGFYNYISGNCQIIENETKNFKLSLDCSPSNCVSEFSEVTFYALVHQTNQNINQPIYRFGGDTFEDEDDKSDTAFFGGIMEVGAVELKRGYEQFFTDETRNFIAYIDGTNYWVEMEQWVANGSLNNTQKAGVVSGLGKSVSFSTVFQVQRLNGTFYYQKGKFKVPKGTKGFIRLVNHKQNTGLGNAQNTSTLVLGTIPNINTYTSTSNINSIVSLSEELYFDTCNGNVTINETLVILDSNIDNTIGNHSSSSYAGYVTDENNLPVEGAEIWQNGSFISRTDHNGFYNFYNYGGNKVAISVQVRAEQNPTGGFTTVETVSIPSNYNYTEKNIKIDIADFTTKWYEDTSIYVNDCNNSPIGGVRVSISGSKSKITDQNGVARFKLRNYSTRNRVIRGVVMDNGGCYSLDCLDQCNPCIPTTPLTTLATSFVDTPYLDVNLEEDLNVNSANINQSGLKAGGRYEWGLVAKSKCGRISAVYPITIMDGSLALEDSFLDVPKTQEKGELSFCSLNYDGTNLVLPDWVDCVEVVRSKNINNYELQWVVDKIERLSDGKVKLLIQSLNDYNALYNFNTNTIYQYVDGDRVEFISNGDGSIFDVTNFGVLNYLILSPFKGQVIGGQDNIPSDFFNEILIQDNGDLDSLTEGAKIEIQRPLAFTVDNSALYSIGVSLEVIEVSGQRVLANPTGTFNSFDTYFVKRQIGLQSIQQFEHRNPSDFWGDRLLGISDIGKGYFKNAFENERRLGRNITINSVNQFNRFGDLEKTLDAPEQGDLISIGIYDGKVGVGIGEYDNFLFQISDDFLRLGNDGIVRAATVDSLISDTQPKVLGQFGCQYEDIGSIYYGDGWITWADISKGALVKHDFNVATDMAEGKMNTYFRQKWGVMSYFNSLSVYDVEKYRFITGFNYHTNTLQLTMKRLDGVNVYNTLDYLQSESETILIEPRLEDFLTMASYAQDGYSNLNTKDQNGSAFISFAESAVYNHPVASTVYNRFNGVSVDRVIMFAINQEPDIIKRAVSLEIQSPKMYFVKKVAVDNTDYDSEIPPIEMKRQEDKWVGSFLSDKNKRGGLYAEGEVANKPRGYFILVTLVRDNTDELKYNTTDNTKRRLFDDLDLILTKYFYSSQSGLIENL
jgi:hypothetical protein